MNHLSGIRGKPRAAPQFRLIDPATISIGTYVRQFPDLDADVLDSIRANGVLTPGSVNESAEGYVLRFGQRRTLVAVAAELPTIPALVYLATAETDEDEVQRVNEKWAESDADRVRQYLRDRGHGQGRP